MVKNCRQNCQESFSNLNDCDDGNCGDIVNDHYHDYHQLKLNQLNQIESECGQPFTDYETDQLWDCLLTSGYFDEDSMNEIELSNNFHLNSWKYGGMNPAKYLCCRRSSSAECRNLCYETFTNNWSKSWEKFDIDCRRSTNQGNEQLQLCLNDADHLCTYHHHYDQSNCIGELRFCRDFIRQTSKHYPLRQCSRSNDMNAEKLYRILMKQNIFNQSTIGNHSYNEIWRRFICYLNFNICNNHNHRQLRICNDNCPQLLQQSLILQKINENSIEIDHNLLCGFLFDTIKQFTLNIKTDESLFASSTNNDGECLNLMAIDDDEDGRELQTNNKELSKCSTRCNGLDQQCQPSFDCYIDDCPRYRCRHMCSIGKLDELKIYADTSIRLPSNDNQTLNCFNQCYCDSNGQLIDCYYHCFTDQMTAVASNDNPKAISKTHRKWQKSLENELNCVENCLNFDETLFKNIATGQIYRNECTVHCYHGTNGRIDWRKFVKVTENKDDQKFRKICMENDRNGEICLIDDSDQLFDLSNDAIITHESIESICRIHSNQTLINNDLSVCDSNGKQRSDICQIINGDDGHDVQISYLSKCLIYCSMAGLVCGRNRQTYRTECAAKSSGIFIDYFDSCIGFKHDGQCSRNYQINNCPQPFLNRIPFNHCPICGTAINFIYDRHYFQRLTNEHDSKMLKFQLLQQQSFSIKTLIKQLKNLLNMSNDICELSSVISLPGIITIMIQSRNISSIQDQNQCQIELNRLKILIVNQSPMIQLQYPLLLLQYDQMIDEKFQELYSPESELRSQSQSKLFNNTNIVLIIFVSFYFSLISM